MKHASVAIITDSGTDVPQELIERFGIFELPLIICFKNREYLDKIEISPEEIYSRLREEIPKTSMPSIGMIKEVFRNIIAQGYEKIIAVTISSGLSGTFSNISMVAKDFPEIETLLLDTKNIGIGAGFTAILAGQLLEKGLSFAEIKEKLISNLTHTKIYFCINTLEYLIKGGRIGLVSGMIGNTLGIKPIISCNEDGIYYTAARTRGWSNSMQKAVEMAKKFAKGMKRYNVAVVSGNMVEEAAKITQQLRALLPNAELVIEGQISPTLGVHTGPELIGVGVQRIE